MKPDIKDNKEWGGVHEVLYQNDLLIYLYREFRVTFGMIILVISLLWNTVMQS